MTFMRKFMDLLNMDNWKSYNKDSTDESPDCENIQYDTVPDYNSHNTTKSKSLKHKNPYTYFLLYNRKYWKNHPQPYDSVHHICSDSSPEEYEYFAKVIFLDWFGKASTPESVESRINSCIEFLHISNPYKIYSSLIEDGYLGPSSIYDILSLCRLTDLRILADSVGCKKNGKKIELIRRIVENMDDVMKDDIISSCNSYSMTEKGKQFYFDNYDYVELNHNYKYNISLAEFNSERILFNKKRTFNDTVYQVLSKRIYLSQTTFYFRHTERDHFHLYEICFSEGRYDIAIKDFILYLYLKSCCIDTIMSYNNDYNTFFGSLYCNVFTLDDAYKMIQMKDFYYDSLIEFPYSIQYPPSLFTQEEFSSVIHDMLHQSSFDADKYNNIAKKRIIDFASIDYNSV